ncbi:MAG TPA: lactate racemase domain-containing protein, partial [Methanomassiliicoccales archaeon]|nr:lactate racemase domain-containing protein [Methanomassiliicoccales archaeon]
MLLKLPYGEGGLLRAEVPDVNLAGIVGPHEVHCIPDEIERALSKPFGRSLESFLKDAEDVVFLVNDGTRPTPTSKVLDVLASYMDLQKARYLIATGA